MKYKINLLPAVSTLILFDYTSTQTAQTNQTQSTDIGGDLERIAAQQTVDMIAQLNLIDSQIPKVKKINLTYA